MKINKKLLAIFLAIPLAVGGIAALITNNGMDSFEALKQPPLSPPGWLFPIVWTLLYAMMGLACYLVVSSGQDREEIRRALVPYGIQLVFNFLWSIIFFNLRVYRLAFVWLILLLILILATMARFRRFSAAAGYLLLPYLLWVGFAGYLNFGIYLLN